MKKSKKIKKNRIDFIGLLKQNKILLLTLFLLFPIFFILYQLYIPRINAFGCFDDCNNFMRGYFVLQGKDLFSEAFSGHQPLGSYLSTGIQFITQPQNIFELILRHRQFMLIFAFIMNAVLIIRFGAKFILITVIYEFSKFYLFGDRFLGDGMIVYLLIYMLGLIFLKLKDKKIYFIDFILAAIFTWFIVFMRAPYVPVAMFSYFIFLWKWPIKSIGKPTIISIVLFTILSLFTIFIHDVGEYFYNVVYFNFQINLQAETSAQMAGPRIFHMFFYPIYILFYGALNEFKIMLIGLNMLFLALFLNIIWNKKYLLALIILLILGLSNIRTVLPGSIFYSAFHMLSWFGLFVFIIVDLLFRKKENKYIFNAGLLILFISFSSLLISPNYFAKDKVDTHAEFITNYGANLQEGEVIKALSDSDDTLFIDGSDDLVYWQSGLKSSYKYSWYTSSMHMLDKYSEERLRMFKENPPDFYREYGYCKKEEGYKFDKAYIFPDFVKDDYIRLNIDDRPSCIYIRKEKVDKLSEEQLRKAAEFRFSLPAEDLLIN